MDGAPGRPRRRVGHVFGEHLLRGVDQDVGVRWLEGEVQIEPGERVLELADRPATLVAPGDAQRMQERQFDRPVLGEQGGGVLAARDSGEEFEQQGLGVFHCDGLVFKRLQTQETIEWGSSLRTWAVRSWIPPAWPHPG